MNERILEANNLAVEAIVEAEPYFIGVERAENVLEGFDEKTILHSGPPVAYDQMCDLHKSAMINAVLFEGFASSEKEAEKVILSGEVKIDSAMNYNTVGSGVGIITRSVPLLVCEDRRSHKKAGVFVHEGKFGGGFCGWGVYSKEIKENLQYMRDVLFAELSSVISIAGGIAIKPVIAKGLQMGDENHSSQTAVDLLFLKEILPYVLKCKNSEEIIMYFLNSSRYFHNFGQCASKCALLNAENIKYSSVVTAAGGNGVEYGIKVSGLGEEWFTAPSPMINGSYMVQGSKRENQLPWIGDSSIVECAGLGGIVSAASPRVCSWRNEGVQKSIETTREMEKITVSKNKHYEIPNLDFDNSPVGIDILKVCSTKILPVIDGGMINKNGGWMGAGCTRIPLECFEKAKTAFLERYGEL